MKNVLIGSLALILTGCQLVPTPMPAPTMPPIPTAGGEIETISGDTDRTLVVCLGSEPQSLYLYGASSEVMWSVLEALYDGPIDFKTYSPEPVILGELPTLENGGVIIEPVSVQSGDIVVDKNGDLVALSDGVEVLPSECGQPECALKWDRTNPFQMDRTRATYSLLPGIKWADGNPLTAYDSIYSFELASDADTPVSKRVIERTASYKALDEMRVEWIGVAGYFPLPAETMFWHPLPQHAWAQFSAEDLLSNEVSTRQPLGWGPYIIEEWVSGSHITLHKNPNYYRIAEGLPRFEKLVYRFQSRPGESTLEALISGECDVVDRTAGLEELAQDVRQGEIDNRLKMYQVQGPEWEQAVFGIRPAAFDIKRPAADQRADLFSDLRMRQAFTYCMDRERVITHLLYERSSIPLSYLPPDHPLYLPDLPIFGYDVAAGARLLDEVGWKDHDNNPQTPRQANGIPGVVDGTELIVNYATTKALLRQEVANLFADSMRLCGIQLNIHYLDPVQLYAPGGDGVVFGRNFDLVQLAWKAGLEPPCLLYVTDQIPTRENRWVGVNVAGYSNPAYDQACLEARGSRPDQSAYATWHAESQRLFTQEIPAVPLYYRVRIAATRPDLCGLYMDTTTRSDLWNLESFDYGAGCN